MANEPGVWTHSVPNQSPALVIVSAVFVIITTLFFAFRQGWRWAHNQHGWDDAMAACAYIMLLIQSIFGGVAAHYGFGKHLADIKPTATKALEYFFLYQICYKLLGGFTKLTFCALYLRIFNQKVLHRLIYVVAGIVAAGSLAFTIGTILQCWPVVRAWEKRIAGHCIDNGAFWYSHAAFNTSLDIVIYIMPMPLIRTLKLARGQKTGVISVFCLGAFVIAASIVRMIMLRASAKSTDPTWGSMSALIWTEVEANTSVICCCLPALRVPFLNVWHKIRGRNRSPTPKLEPQRPTSGYDCGWLCPEQSQVSAAHSPGREVSYDSEAHGYSRNGKSGHSPSNAPHCGDNWYGRVMKNLNKESDASGSNSKDDFVGRHDSSAPPRLKLGAIYKTTDVHVSLPGLPQ